MRFSIFPASTMKTSVLPLAPEILAPQFCVTASAQAACPQFRWKLKDSSLKKWIVCFCVVFSMLIEAKAVSPPSTITPGTQSWLLPNPFSTIYYPSSITTSSQIDYYAFVPDQSGNYIISTSGALDTQMRVYNSSGTAITGVIDSTSAGETVTLNLTTGLWYYIGVSAYNGHTGSYAINLDGPDYPQTTITTSAPTYTGSSSGAIDYGGDQDYFKITAPNGVTSLNLTITPSSTLDTDTYLYDNSGNILTHIDTNGTGASDTLTGFSIAGGSTYYIGVTGYGRTQTGSYTVNADFNPDQDYGDPPASVTPGTGYWLVADPFGNVSLSDTISAGNQVNLYAFIPDATGTYTISTTGSLDSQLRVYNSSGTAITSTIDSSSGGESTSQSLSAGSWYYIAVTGYQLNTGNYTISIDGPNYARTSLSTPAPAYSGSANGAIDYGGDVDYWQVTAPNGTTSLNLTISPSSGLDTYIELFDDSGNYLQNIDTGGNGSSDSATGISIMAGTTYFVGISANYRTQTGTYSIAADFNPDQPPFGDLSLTLKKVDGSNAPQSSSPLTPRIVLYTNPSRQVSGTNPALFQSVPTGTYLVEGYHTGTFWGEEFWNSEQMQINGNQTNVRSLTRKYPYATGVVMKDEETGATIAPGQSIAAGTRVRFEVTVKNDVPNTPLSTQVSFALDLSQSGSFDYDWPLSTAQVISGSGGTALYTFTTALNGFQTGQFYFALEVKTGVGTNIVRTDSWNWTQACNTTGVRTIYGIAPRAGQTPTPVFLARYPAGGTASIDPNLRTWIIIHGRTDSSTAAWVSGPTGLAAAIAGIYPNDQILLLDWTDAAADTTFPPSSGEDWIKPVAAWAAGKLVDYGFAGSNLNLMGHSWGGNMTAEIAELIPYIPYIHGHVNSIVALDPAEDGSGSFDPESLTADSGLPEIDFARNSVFSWAFHSSLLGSESTPTTAHEAFIVDTGLNLVTGAAHDAVHDIFTYMLKNSSGGVSSHFQLSRLLAHQSGPWTPNLFTTSFQQGADFEFATSGYEGRIGAILDGLSPKFLEYDDSLSQYQLVYETTDITPPTVTVNQASGQSDPTSSSPINFTVVFSEAVTGFASGDVTLGGTAGATGKSVTGSGTTYTVAVSGMTQNGTVTATIPAGVAQDAAGNGNLSSTSSDNTVTYSGVSVVAQPTISPSGGSYTGSVAITLACATSGATIYYTTNGSNPTTGSAVYSSAFTLTSSATVKAKAVKSGSNDSMIASVGFTVNIVVAAGGSMTIGGGTYGSIVIGDGATLTFGEQALAPIVATAAAAVASASITSNAQLNPTDGQTYLTVTYQRRTDAPSLTYEIQTTTDLVTWATAGEDVELVTVAPKGGNLEMVTARIHPPIGSPGTPAKFVRVRVKQP